MNWIETVSKKRKALQKTVDDNKHRVTLKPHHYRKLENLWKDEYVNGSISRLFEATYAEPLQEMSLTRCALLDKVKQYDFVGKTYPVPTYSKS